MKHVNYDIAKNHHDESIQLYATQLNRSIPPSEDTKRKKVPSRQLSVDVGSHQAVVHGSSCLEFISLRSAQRNFHRNLEKISLNLSFSRSDSLLVTLPLPLSHSLALPLTAFLSPYLAVARSLSPPLPLSPQTSHPSFLPSLLPLSLTVSLSLTLPPILPLSLTVSIPLSLCFSVSPTLSRCLSRRGQWERCSLCPM